MLRLLEAFSKAIPDPMVGEIAKKYKLNKQQRKIFYGPAQAIINELDLHFDYLGQPNYPVVWTNLVREERKQEFLETSEKIIAVIGDKKIKHALVELVKKSSKLFAPLSYYNDLVPETKVYYDRIISLHESLGSLSIDKIIVELKSIREGHGTIPNIPPWSEHSLCVYRIFNSLHAREDLNSKHVSELVKMLGWQENSMESSHMSILFAVVNHASAKFREDILRHLEWVTARYERARPGTSSYAEASSQKRYIEDEVLPLCT